MTRGAKITIGVLLGLVAIVVVLIALAVLTPLAVVSIKIELPPPAQSTLPAEPVFVTLTTDGRMAVDGAPTTLETLEQDVAKRFAGTPKDQQHVMIRASGDVTYERFMAVSDRLKAHGWSKIGLVTDGLPHPGSDRDEP